MDHILCPFEVKAGSDNSGIITGYGSVFGNVDSYGDTVAKGAFRKSIADIMTGAKSWPAMLLQHGDATSDGNTPIGIWTKMEEDDRGLRLEGKLAIKNRRGAEAYALLRMTPRPALDGLSIGYRAKDYELHRNGPAKRTLKAIDLVEVSLVTFPADSRARITGVKSWLDRPVVDEAALFKNWAMADVERLRRMHRLAHDWPR